MVPLAILFILIISVPGFCFESKFGTKGLGYDIPTSCCHSYTHHRLPYHLIVDFYETSSLCLKPAIVFLTSKGRQICANPKYEWVQRYILLLKQKIRTE
ncbi:C-C motif chemokine 4-like [Monodelphis domestica]|uniref:C-C motif chemokine 4-like n=1 Tax=Monodelphis domestica TaxID=13616 RepID=UPI0024E202A3|nr:C-C motif chemokine 4-like [Monodelphis domestica]